MIFVSHYKNEYLYCYSYLGSLLTRGVLVVLSISKGAIREIVALFRGKKHHSTKTGASRKRKEERNHEDRQ